MSPNPNQPRRRRRKTRLPANAPDVASPCVSVCEMDEQTGFCTGCYRTLAEIATWSRIPNETRWEIVQSLRERRAQLNDKASPDDETELSDDDRQET